MFKSGIDKSHWNFSPYLFDVFFVKEFSKQIICAKLE